MRGLICLLVLLAGCGLHSGDVGKDNAVKMVREAMGSMEARSIEVVQTDSLLCDMPLVFAGSALVRAETAYLEERVSADSLKHAADLAARIYQDIGNSWTYGSVVNDSLRHVQSYGGAWRRVHTVEVTLSSGKKERTRVLMDSDGITPRCLENEFIESINKYLPDIERADRTLRRR